MDGPHCARCRLPAPADAPCPRCGMWTRTPPPARRPADRPVEAQAAKRPRGVIVLALVLILGGIALFVIGTAGRRAGSTGPGEIALAALGVAQVAVGLGLLGGGRWAWWAAAASAVVGVFRDGYLVARGDGVAVVSLAINAAILIYLSQRGVRAWFGLPGGV